MYTVYLAGKISGLNYEEANKNRKEFVEKAKIIDIKCRNPLRGKSKLTEVNVIDLDAVSASGLSIQEIIQRDLNDIDNVDCVVILTGDAPSWGTSGEFWYATWIAKKPTLVIAKNYMGGWLDLFSTKIVKDVDSAISVLAYWKDYWNGAKAYEEA